MLVKEYIFGKVAGRHPENLSKKKKKNSVTGIFKLICVHFRSPSFKADLKEKSNNFKTSPSCHEIFLQLYCMKLVLRDPQKEMVN